MTVEHRSDHELIQRICERDNAAFEALFARYHEQVRQHLLRTLRDRHAAEDLTQEVFLRVWTRAEQWNGTGAFSAWMLRIATNLALNHLRTVRRRRELPLEPSPDPDGDEHASSSPAWLVDTVADRPEQALEQLEWRERLQRLLQQLSEEKREVFHLAHDVEMDVREIALSLGIPEGTVRSRLHYARKQLARDWHSKEEDS
jgi:RNA polymerase sigma-70 factor (ECF subfamily)